MKGEAVDVKTFKSTETDPFGAPINSPSIDTVDNVLVAPGARSDVFESNRPSGVRVAYTLYFPKTFDGDLEGAKVKVRGKDPWLDVIGRPDHHTAANVPGDWWIVAEVGTIDG